MLTERLMQLTIAAGSEWVMVVLLALSVISIAIVIERAMFFRKRGAELDRLDAQLMPLIHAEERDKVQELVKSSKEPTLVTALASGERDREATEKLVASVLGRERLRLEKRLTFLGTLGNNAPFIGLFGTVLGIIRAFRDLSQTSAKGDPSVVMAGISEALVATAVGLFVAIPAVIAFNYFQKQADRTLSISESLAQSLLADVPQHTGASEQSSPSGS